MRGWTAVLVIAAACSGKQAATTDAARGVDAAEVDASAPDAMPDASTPDAMPDATPDASVVATSCDPVAQTGCSVGEKCTWVRLAASQSSQVGELGCTPDGVKTLDDSCMWGAAGATTGYDNCAKGFICLASARTDQAAGTCSAICDTSAQAGSARACATGFACGLYFNFFANAGDPQQTNGLCDHTCNPLTDVRDDGAAYCGGVLASGSPTKGCYGLPTGDATPSHFTCSAVIDPSKKSDAYAYDASLGYVALNACATGYIPLLYDDTTDAIAQDQMKVLCVALCQPAPTSSSAKTNAGGATPYTCAAAGAGGSHECRYWWFLEGATSPVSTWSNGLGYCFNYANYYYDATALHPPQSSTMAPDPSCMALSSTAMTFDAGTGGAQTVPDNVYWGCGPTAKTFTGGARPAHAPSGLRPLL